MTGTLHEELRAFMIISRRILLRTRNIPHKSCTDHKTRFVFKHLPPPKTTLFMTKFGKI